MRALALAALLASAGCAATNGGGVASKVREAGNAGTSQAVDRPASVAAAPADSSWLHWTAPATKARWCGDSAGVQRDAVHASILKINTVTPPGYYHGCEADPDCWARVRAFNTPDTVWSAWAAPGARCSVRVGAGEYVADVTRSRCKAWRVVRVQPAASAAKEGER